MAYLLLAFSILAEVFGTTMLKVSNGFSRVLPTIGMIVGFIVAFYVVSLAMIELPLGFAYAIWGGAGTVLTALIGVWLFKEKINRQGVLGMSLLIVGIVLLNVG